MAYRKPFYVLGAGTSAGLVPFTSDTRKYIREQYSQIGIYPIDSNGMHLPFHERGIRPTKTSGYDIYDILLEHIPLETSTLLAQKAWARTLDGLPPPQYLIFQRGSPGVYFNFNVDGLASHYLRPRSIVYEPHGSVDRLLTMDLGFSDRLEMSLDVALRPNRSLILPGPEPTSVTRLRSYKEAACYIRRGRDVIILGYSFGTFKGRMDDSESFEYLIDHLARVRSRVFVVSPDPGPIATAIEDRLRTNCVLPVHLYWDVFSTVSTRMTEPAGTLSDLLPRSTFEALVSFYERALGDAGKSIH